MSHPVPSPAQLWIRLEPGESKPAQFTIESAPTAAAVSASVVGAEGLVTLSQMVVDQRFFRRMTEEEILELPPIPPSIRERARKSGRVEETQEFDRSDGQRAVSVPENARVQIALAISAAAQLAPEIVDSKVVLHATGWDQVSVPVRVVVGRVAMTPEVNPVAAGRVVEPGDTSRFTVAIASAPSDAKVAAFVLNGEGMISLRSVIAFDTLHKQFTEDEILEMPPLPPSIREQARRDGYIEHVETARSLGDMPLMVARGQLVTFELLFTPPLQDFPLTQTTRLVIDAPNWQRTEIPVRLIVGVLDVTLDRPGVRAAQGGSAEFEVTLTLREGPATEVEMALGMGDDSWHVEPSRVLVPRGTTVRQTLRAIIGSRAPVGSFAPGFDIRYFDGLSSRSRPFQLDIDPAAVELRLLQPSLALSQGGSATAQVEIRSEGGHKLMTFRAVSLPDGVTMAPERLEMGYGAGHAVVVLKFVAAGSARPVRDDFVGVEWSAGDGVHGGQLPLRITVILTPESRVFEHVITTPSGTALGGRVTLTLHNDGRYTYSGEMSGSGFDPYSFRISAVARARDGSLSVAAMKSGTVGGTLGGGSRRFEWSETGHSVHVAEYWATVRDSEVEFVKWYEDTGVLGTLGDIAEAVANFLVGSVIVGPHVAAAILIGSELGKLTDLPFAHPSALAGVVVAGATVLVLGPGFVLPAVVAGIAAGAQIRTRRMRPSEREFADTVFAGTIPFDRILLTNLDRAGRAFCVPHLDGSILMGLGGEEDGVSRFDDPLRTEDLRRTFIHELTHAWQIVHRTIALEMFWQAAANEARDRTEVYSQWEAKLDGGRAWDDFGLEDQAQIVGYWSTIARADKLVELVIAGQPPVEPLTLNSRLGLLHRAFPYIERNIRTGTA